MKLKLSILNALKEVYKKVGIVGQVLISLLRIFIYSGKIKSIPKATDLPNSVYILGNGPSLKGLVNSNWEFLKDQLVFVVNDFFFNDKFSLIKPKVYILADPGYWDHDVPDAMKDLRNLMQMVLIEKVTWNLQLYIPYVVFRSGYFQSIYRTNPLIQILPFNTTPVNGPDRFRFCLYKKNLAKPFSGNVIGSAIFIAMQMGIKEILLFGVEHSWTKSLFVDDQNRTCIAVEHFYNDSKKGTVWYKANGTPYRIYEALFDVAKMLEGYEEIKTYAGHLGIQIFNCTPDTFIDTFPRKMWTKD